MKLKQHMWSWSVSYPYKWGTQTNYFRTKIEALDFMASLTV